MKAGKGLTACCVCILLVASWVLPVWGCAKSHTGGMVAAGTVDRFGRPVMVVDTGMLRWLALGDSYTIGQSVGEGDRYPIQAAGLLKNGGVAMGTPEIIATTGWTTQNLQDAIRGKTATPPYAVVTLLIGVNNQFQGRSLDEYRAQFAALLGQSIQLAGERPGRVIVLSIPDYSVTPFAAGYDRAAIARSVDVFNAASQQLSAQYKVQWLDVTTASRMAARHRSTWYRSAPYRQ